MSGARSGPEGPQEVFSAETLSAGQQALWHVCHDAPSTSAYNLSRAFVCVGKLDRRAMAAAVDRLVGRHELLRSTFPSHAGRVERRHASIKDVLEFADASLEDESSALASLQRWADIPFSLETEIPFRARVIGRGDGCDWFQASVHHIAADFWSLAILLEDLDRFYSDEIGASASSERSAPLFRRFVDMQSSWLESPRAERASRYWVSKLTDLRPLVLRSTPSPVVGRAHLLRSRIESTELRRLREKARAWGANMDTLLLAAWLLVLRRYGGSEDALVGYPVALRRKDMQELVGFCANTIPVAVSLGVDVTFEEAVRRTRTNLLSGFKYRHLPTSRILSALRAAARADVGERMLSMYSYYDERWAGGVPNLALLAMGEGGQRLELGALKLETISLRNSETQYAASLLAGESESALHFALEYRADSMRPEIAESLLAQVHEVLEHGCGQVSVTLGELDLARGAERARVLDVYAPGERPPAMQTAGCSCISQLVELQAASDPGRVALATAEGCVSYAELARRVSELTCGLRRLVGPQPRIGILMQRSPDMVAGLLAVLRAGGTYVPLDARWPIERITTLLRHAELDALLTDDAAAAGRLRLPVRILEPAGLADAGRGYHAADIGIVSSHPMVPAYLLYTSGTTGTPKGVLVSRGNLAAFLDWAVACFGPGALSRVLASTTITFDLSVFEIFAPLICGGCAVLVDSLFSWQPEAPGCAATLVNSVPSLLREFLRHSALPKEVSTVCLAGEALPEQLVRELSVLGISAVWNLYGPTETTTYSTFARLSVREPELRPIGRPVAGTRVYVLNRDFEPVGVGVCGELFIAGDGVALGYLGNPRSTAERFLPDPYGPPGSRLYRTGDWVRWTLDGSLEYLGRRDDQVKVNGVRVELAEIEGCLSSIAGIRGAGVSVEQSRAGQPTLVAHLIADDTLELEVTHLMNQCLRRLPASFIPQQWFRIRDLPLDAHGKLNRAGLPLVPRIPLASGAARVAPRSETEVKLVEIWRELLPAAEEIGVDDDFYAMGGHSLLLLRLLWLVQAATGVRLEHREVLDLRCISELASYIDEVSSFVARSRQSAGGQCERGEI
jgi:myxalamid-type nonribosomal peptide synthetase MxaA